jgi:RNA polymerase sigma factor (TIGR02999 family)
VDRTDPPGDEPDALLARVRQGDPQALNALFQSLYPELRRLARRRLRSQTPITLLDTGALVHEAFERLSRLDRLSLQDRAHFLAYAATAMRSIAIDAARQRLAQRRGGAERHVTLTPELDELLAQAADPGAPDVMRLHEALQALAQIEPRLERVVEMRYFGGLTHAEIATALGLGQRTVERDWERARLVLYAMLNVGGLP